MSTVLSDRCPKCGRTISYTSEATELQCPCGHRFLVVEFVSERLKMEKAQEDSRKAQQELAAAEAEKTALQNRLNGTLTALDGILGSQRAEDAKLEGILDSLKADRQTHDAMTALLHALRRDQQSGQDALSRLLDEVMKRQSGAAEKLTAVQELATRILNAQKSGAKAVEQMQKEVLEKIRALDLSLEKMLDLSSDFFAWSRSMQQADVQRLQSLQSSSDALLQGQKHMTAKLDSLSQSIDHIQKIIDSGFNQLRKQRLDTLIALYHQATGLQIEREFEKAEDTYRKLLAMGGQDAQDAEVYWRMLLCHYGVEYQEENGKIIPIILRPDLTEPDKMQVRKDLFDHVKTEEQRAYYTERLNKMDFYLDRYRKLRMDKNWQYDVFISVKQNDNGHHTSDSDRASELYFYFKDKPELAAKHLRVFNSRHTPLPKGEEYEPYIITALMSAKLLIVVGSKPEYMNSRWVRNEWQRFQYLQEQDKAKTGKTERRLFCYFVDGMDSEKLPGGLNPNAQGIMGGIKAGDEILDVAEEVFPGPASQSGPFTAQPEAETPEQIADKMKLWLQLGQYQKVLDQYDSLVNTRPEILKNVPWICLDTLCAKNGFRRLKSLASERPNLRADPLYEFAYKYADTALREWLDALWPAKTKVPDTPAGKLTSLILRKMAEYRDRSASESPAPPKEESGQEKQYPDGRYVGQLVNGKRHGRGVMYYEGGHKYDGEWRDDKRSGKGVLTMSDGGRYDGEWKDGKRNGKGVLTVSDGSSKYDGEWKDGKRDGKGTFIMSDGSRYEGEWKDDRLNGKGIMYYESGHRYEGEWKDDKRNGKGKFYFPNGNWSEGEWKDDKHDGMGVMYLADGSKYDGEWKNDKFNGKGIYSYKNGDKYDGQWQDDKRNGMGVYYFHDGRRYEGIFLNNDMVGDGTLITKDGKRIPYQNGKEIFPPEASKEAGNEAPSPKSIAGKLTSKLIQMFPGNSPPVSPPQPASESPVPSDPPPAPDAPQEKSYPNGKYVGHLVNGKRHGKGVIYYENGGKYDGEWKDDKRSGKGVLYYGDDDKYDGEWKDDTLNGKGVYYYPGGDKYEGEFRDGKRNGKGVYYYKNGDRCDGEWKDLKIMGVRYYHNGDRFEGELFFGTPMNGTLITKDGKRISYKSGKKKRLF